MQKFAMFFATKDPTPTKGYTFLKSSPYPLPYTLLTLPFLLTIIFKPPYTLPLSLLPLYPLTLYLGCDFIDSSLVLISSNGRKKVFGESTKRKRNKQ